MRRIPLYALLLLAPLVFLGCSAHRNVGLSPEDNPEHHYLSGMEALEKGQAALAGEKFERALHLDERFAKAYAGLAIVHAGKAKGQGDAGYREVESGRALENLKKAAKYAKGPDEEFDCDVAAIRAHTLLKGEGWLDEAEDAWKAGRDVRVDDRALTYYQGREAISYFMGNAYLEALEFQKARDRYSEVLNARRDGKWHEKADRGWKRTDRIVRALAGITVGDVGKQVAVKESVSRADLSALLVDEMRLDKLMAGRIPLAASQRKEAEFTPADVLASPFRNEILTAMKWQVRGLEPKFDDATRAYLFKPGDGVSRGEMAFIMEDVLIKLTGDEKLASAYFGQEKSPFPDVRSTSPLYNAVMNVTTRGIMEGELSGEFRPNDAVDGAEALLAVRVLRQRMNIY